MKLKKIISTIEDAVSPELACEWDNVGLLCGDPESEISAVLTAVDIDESVIDEALSLGANLIVTHHPVMFRGINAVTDETIDGKIIRLLLKNGINLYSARTNLDSIQNNCDIDICNALGLEDIQVIAPNGENTGFGRVGSLKKTITADELIDAVKKHLGCKYLRYAKANTENITKIAVCGGDGADFIKNAKEMGADAYITGDCKYHNTRDAVFLGITVIDAGHFNTEKRSKVILKDIITSKLPELTVFCSQSEKDIFEISCG